MPHRPDSDPSDGHSAPEMAYSVDPSMHPPQQSYGVPTGSYPPSNMWAAYPTTPEGAYPSAYPTAPEGAYPSAYLTAPEGAYLSAYPPHMIGHQSGTERGAHEGHKSGDQGKRMRSGHDMDEPPTSTMAIKSEQESPASTRETLPVISESSSGSRLLRGREPLKKRKKHLDVLRRNRCWLPAQQGDFDPPGRILSPVSSVCSSNHNNTPPTVHPSRAELYDMRKAQALTESAKIGDSAEITHPAIQAEVAQYQAVLDFPEALHVVLSQSDANGSVLQWLSHGHAWRVVRWDALRRNILPRYFPQLCQGEDDGKNGGSIDAFLWNVRVWGFEEIKDGPDVGAYAHRYFVRGVLKLSRQMKFSSLSWEDEAAKSHPESRPSEAPRSPGHAKNLLRVPSLATSRSDGSGENRRPDTPETYQQWRYHPKDEYPRTNPYHDMYHGGAYGWHYPVSMPHQHDDPSMTGRHYQAHSGFRHGVTCPSPYDSRYPFRSHPDNNDTKATPQAAPTSIRSSRGGGRLGTYSSSQFDSNSNRPSFPVSQRGKGSRGAPRVCRTPLPDQSSQGSDEAKCHKSPLTPSDSSAAMDDKAGSLSSPRETFNLTHKSKKLLLLERYSASNMDAK